MVWLAQVGVKATKLSPQLRRLAIVSQLLTIILESVVYGTETEVPPWPHGFEQKSLLLIRFFGQLLWYSADSQLK